MTECTMINTVNFLYKNTMGTEDCILIYILISTILLTKTPRTASHILIQSGLAITDLVMAETLLHQARSPASLVLL